MRLDVLVLNYNGRALLAECLPSVVEAAAACPHVCRVAVVDNGSTDDSLAWLAQHMPSVEVFRCPNRGLCSFNDVLPRLDGDVAVLLNNDLRLQPDCLTFLAQPFCAATVRRLFLVAAQCRQWNDGRYEGQKTAVRWRRGLVQATSLFPGCESAAEVPGPTASAGAAIAVDRRIFLALSGFDPLYLPGRLEDLDLAYRAWQAGYRCWYEPRAIVHHRGAASFSRRFGSQGCHDLALRNTLLFQWKNLSSWRHRWNQSVWLPLRLALDLLRCVGQPRTRRFAFARATYAAWRRWRQWRSARAKDAGCDAARERLFFRRFAADRLLRDAQRRTRHRWAELAVTER